MNEQCQSCSNIFPSGAINGHHTSYEPEIIIRICSSCHSIIHHPPQSLDEIKLLHPNLIALVMANEERVEKERWEREELNRKYQQEIMEKIEEERIWKFAFKNGFSSYDVSQPKTKEDEQKLIETGFEFIHMGKDEQFAFYRRPKKYCLADLPVKDYSKIDDLLNKPKRKRDIESIEEEIVTKQQKRLINFLEPNFRLQFWQKLREPKSPVRENNVSICHTPEYLRFKAEPSKEHS